MNKNIEKSIRSIPIWNENIKIQTIDGGLTNQNFLIEENNKKYVVRLGDDIPEHLVSRSNELIVSKAASNAGISPKVIYHSEGILVLDYIECTTLSAEGVRKNIKSIIPLIKKIVFGHNDLLPANFLDDGSRFWIIDWEYAGYNTPLFDLGGLSSNNDFSFEEETYLLENYFENKINDKLLLQYNSLKCASLLRETMWSMVSELTSKIDFDYANYTQENLLKFNQSYKSLDF